MSRVEPMATKDVAPLIPDAIRRIRQAIETMKTIENQIDILYNYDGEHDQNRVLEKTNENIIPLNQELINIIVELNELALRNTERLDKIIYLLYGDH